MERHAKNSKARNVETVISPSVNNLVHNNIFVTKYDTVETVFYDDIDLNNIVVSQIMGDFYDSDESVREIFDEYRQKLLAIQ